MRCNRRFFRRCRTPPSSCLCSCSCSDRGWPLSRDDRELLDEVPIPPFINLSRVKALIRAGLVRGCQILRGHLGGADDPIEKVGAEQFHPHPIHLPGVSRQVGTQSGRRSPPLNASKGSACPRPNTQQDQQSTIPRTVPSCSKAYVLYRLAC
jgi:hypothetical protein